MVLPPLLAAPLVAAAALAGRALAPPPPGSVAPRVRVEHFVVERAVQDPEGRRRTEAVAVVALRRLRLDGVAIRERDVQFREAGARLLLDEVTGEGAPRLVWRELRTSPTAGRTWMVERGADGSTLFTQGWGRRAAVHGRLEGGAEALFPLELLEHLRREPHPRATATTLDPLTESVVALSVACFPVDLRASAELARVPSSAARALARPLGPACCALTAAATLGRTVLGLALDGRRTLELRCADGSLAGRYVFEGERLVAFQWQEGPRWARRIDERRYLELAAKWRSTYDPIGDLRRAVGEGRVRRR